MEGVIILKNEEDLKNEDNLKNEDDIKNENEIKNIAWKKGSWH